MTQLGNNLTLIEELSYCPYCASSRKHVILTRNMLRIVKCSECSLLYTDRRWNKEGLRLYYQDGYYTGRVPGAYKNYDAEKEEKLLDFNRKYRFLRKFASGEMLLDVGCASGFSLSAAASVGFTAEGIDLSSWAISHNRSGLNIFHKELDAFEGEDRYDAISMWDVIEHFLEPEKAFHKLNQLLHPGGVLIFTYPDPTSWISRILGKHWGALTPEEHYFFYPPSILNDWLARCGFHRLCECREKRLFSLAKLLQKIFPAGETTLNKLGIGGMIVAFTIPYKRMAVFRKISRYG